MDDGKTIIIFGLAFLLLAAASVGSGQSDPLTPALNQAQTNLAVGAQASMTFDAIFTMVWKGIVLLLLGGAAWFVFTYGPKLYRQWEKRNAVKWKGGPNAYWGKQPREPRLTRNDLMFYALANREGIRPEWLTNMPRPQINDDSEILL
jgi:hypothetical protein